MRLPILLALAVTVLSVGACASTGPGDKGDRDAQLRLERGLTALEAGYYADAFDDLAWVHSRCAGYEAGTGALAALAAIELDPRNPDARPDLGTQLLARLIRGPTRASSRVLAETTLLTTVALGALHPDDDPATSSTDPHAAAIEPQPGVTATGCGPAMPAPDTTRSLPRLPGVSMAELLTAAEAARDSVGLRADSLGLLLSVVQEQLTATREELERIRRTLRP